MRKPFIDLNLRRPDRRQTGAEAGYGTQIPQSSVSSSGDSWRSGQVRAAIGSIDHALNSKSQLRLAP